LSASSLPTSPISPSQLLTICPILTAILYYPRVSVSRIQRDALHSPLLWAFPLPGPLLGGKMPFFCSRRSKGPNSFLLNTIPSSQSLSHLRFSFSFSWLPSPDVSSLVLALKREGGRWTPNESSSLPPENF